MVELPVGSAIAPVLYPRLMNMSSFLMKKRAAIAIQSTHITMIQVMSVNGLTKRNIADKSSGLGARQVMPVRM